MLTAADLLNNAAYLAEGSRGPARAIAAAWSALHVDGPGNEWPAKPAMMAAFGAWMGAEDVSGEVTKLGGILRRRYKTPVEIAGSLRRAADSVSA